MPYFVCCAVLFSSLLILVKIPPDAGRESRLMWSAMVVGSASSLAIRAFWPMALGGLLAVALKMAALTVRGVRRRKSTSGDGASDAPPNHLPLAGGDDG
ncbi:MAG: hypothetical protein AAF961_16370 [Planctomycetota bacterium]